MPIRYEKSGRIATITINRPEALNAIDPATNAELVEAWTDFRDDPEVWVGILTGAGFCWDHGRERIYNPEEENDLGHFFLALNPTLFLPLEEFKARVDRMIEQVKSGEKAEGVQEIYLPGEIEMRQRAENLRAGTVPLLPSTYAALRKFKEEFGIESDLVVSDA